MTYRKSHYCIDVKLEKADGKYMLVHSYTGAIDIISKELADYLKNTKEFDKETFSFSEATFEMLAKRGHITQKSMEEEREHVRRLATILHKSSKKSSKLFLFMVTYDCNFRCPYCYEGGISSQGNQWSKKRFSKEMVDRTYEAMAEIEPDEKKRWKTITLYGGEPLLKENVDIVKYIIEKGTVLGYEFEAITNGHDLDHYVDLLATQAIKRLQITLDGTREMHNSRRYHYETGDSFDVVFKNIGLALENNVPVSVRFNADAKNFEEAAKLTKLFEEAGYSEKKHFGFHTALLRGDENIIGADSSLMDIRQRENNEISDENITYLNREEFNKMHEDAGLVVNHQDYGLYAKLTNTIYNGTYLQLSSVFCGVQSNMYIFDPYGDMYNCWETVGIKKHIIGNYTNGVIFYDEIKNWQERNIGNTPKCSACKYSLFCGGGCVAKALRFAGSFNKSYCDNYGDIFRLSANIVYDGWQKDQLKRKKTAEPA